MKFPWASYYTISVILHFSPEQFWRTSPFKLKLLWVEYIRLNGLGEGEEEQTQDEKITYRDGKAYRFVDAKNAQWL